MTPYYLEPGLYTDIINPFDQNGLNWPFLHDCGFTWVSFQVYNPQLYTGVKDFDLPAVKAHGFSNVGVWGVIYDRTDFYSGGVKIGSQAIKLNAGHIKIDTEQVYKGTRVGKLGAAIIKGVRDAGWTKGISLSTLGNPTDPLRFDFEMDTQSFLDSGEDAAIEPQDYPNDFAEYTPKNSSVYWKRMGVPDNKISHTIGLYNGQISKITGAQWVALLQDGNVKNNFSVYMAQDGSRSDYLALKTFIESNRVPAAQPPQTMGYTSTQAKSDMLFAAQKWLNGQLPNRQVFSRIRTAKRILQTTDKQWTTLDTEVKQVLDDAGVTP